MTEDTNMADDTGTPSRHPSFGMIELSRVTGRMPLFGVDTPQGHFIAIRIHGAVITRDRSHHHIHPDKVITEIALSEVQFAQWITSPNTGGTPCTLRYVPNPDGTLTKVELPPRHMADSHTMKKEIKQTADKALDAVKEAEEFTQALRKKGSVSKNDLDRLSAMLSTARREGVANLKWVIDQGVESIKEAGERTKAEISAYSDHLLRERGLHALPVGTTSMRPQLTDGEQS